MIDVAKFKVKAGSGGDGLVSFRHEKYAPKGGPDGGNGGRGGSVFFEVDENLTTLMDFRAKALFHAPDGEPGGKNVRTGATGGDLILKVPIGTVVKDLGGKEPIVIADLTKNGERFLLARGGVGGRGNDSFKSSVNRTPTQFTRGEPGEEREILLEIKLIADVGLIGLPNAGKSTLLNALTRAHAKVGDYPFTTIEPNLGVMDVPGRHASYVLADLPGLIEGAASGKGLGDTFLRHAERTRLLVHVIDPLLSDPIVSYKTIRNELLLYSSGLVARKEIVVVNKVDITEVSDQVEEVKKDFAKIKVTPLFVSGATGEGIEALRLRIADELVHTRKHGVKVATPIKTYTISNLRNRKMVFRGKPEVAAW